MALIWSVNGSYGAISQTRRHGAWFIVSQGNGYSAELRIRSCTTGEVARTLVIGPYPDVKTARRIADNPECDCDPRADAG